MTAPRPAQYAAELAQHGRLDEAERVYRDLVGHVLVTGYEYDDWLRGLARVLEQQKRRTAAGYVHLYLHELDRARSLFDAAPGLARGRTYELEKRFAYAARSYEEAGGLAHAGVQLEKAGDEEGARVLWARLLDHPRLGETSYERALVHFNLGLAIRRAGRRRGDAGAEAAAESQLVMAQRILEQVADDFETKGLRDRAFDCWAIFLKLGRESGSFENLAEGYLNCIRLLKEDHLKFYVLQYYEDFLRIALEREELHAAAILFKEAAAYSARAGLVYDRHYLGRAAETFLGVATKNQRLEGPVEESENACLAAIECQNAIGDFAAVAETYRRLAALAVGEERQTRYRMIAGRYDGVEREEGFALPFPGYLRQPHAYAAVWHADLLEWELEGDPVEICAAIVGNSAQPDTIRRRALLTLLRGLDARERSAAGMAPDALAAIAANLGAIQSFSVLAVLERLAVHSEPVVRAAVARALRSLFYKRTFVTLERALADPSPAVRAEAVGSLRQLHFPHAFDPLTRLFREQSEPAVRVAALESLGRIGSLEVAEFLIDVVRQEEPAYGEIAARALALSDNPDLRPILRRHAELATGPVRRTLERILARLASSQLE